MSARKTFDSTACVMVDQKYVSARQIRFFVARSFRALGILFGSVNYPDKIRVQVTSFLVQPSR